MLGGVINIVWRMVEKIPDLMEYAGKCTPGINLLNLPTQILGHSLITHPKGNITIKNLTISYDHKIIINNFSIDVTSGDRIYILGESGMGKSTLINTIYGFINYQSGNILFDNVDLKNIDRNFFVTYCNYIQSKKTLFYDTLRNNLFGENEEKINKMLEVCVLKSTVELWEEGLNTVINNNASSISNGQCQRINICRSMMNYEKSKILLMDEPLVALDDYNATLVLSNIMQLYSSQTIICTDHSLKFLHYANKIIFMDNEGVIVCEKNKIHDYQRIMNYINNFSITNIEN